MHMFENKAFNLLNKGKQSSGQELHELVALAIELLKNEDRKINVPVISEMTGIPKQALYRSEKIRGLLGTKARSHVRKINIGVVNGKVLSRRRELLGFSQRDLAKKIDEEQSYISIAENQGLIGKDKLKRLCDILGLDSTKFEGQSVSPCDKLVLEPTLSSYLKFISENYFLKPESVAVNQHEMSSEVEPFDPLLYKQAVNLLVKDKVLVAHAVLADHYYQQELNSLVSLPSSSDASQETPQPEEDEEDKFLVIMSGSNELHTVKDAEAAQALIKKLVSTTGFDMSRSFHIYKLVSVASAEVRIVSTDC